VSLRTDIDQTTFTRPQCWRYRSWAIGREMLGALAKHDEFDVCAAWDSDAQVMEGIGRINALLLKMVEQPQVSVFG
jgi:hypothetical protein